MQPRSSPFIRSVTNAPARSRQDWGQGIEDQLGADGCLGFGADGSCNRRMRAIASRFFFDASSKSAIGLERYTRCAPGPPSHSVLHMLRPPHYAAPVRMLPVMTVVAAAFVATLAIAPGRAAQGPADGASAADRALYEAAQNGDIAAITTLLNAGANVNAAIPGDGSPRLGAARAGRLDAVRLLLDQGADPNMAVPGDGSALIAAFGAGHVNVVNLLLDRGAEVDQVVLDNENALIQASGAGRRHAARSCSSRGARTSTHASGLILPARQSSRRMALATVDGTTRRQR